MINNLHKIGVVTSDVESAVDFFTKVLDLEVVERLPSDVGEDYVFMQAAGVKVELLPQKAMDAPEGVHHLSFRVDSVDEACEELRSKGVKILVEPFDVGVAGIRLAFFEGPDGLRLQLFQREE